MPLLSRGINSRTSNQHNAHIHISTLSNMSHNQLRVVYPVSNVRTMPGRPLPCQSGKPGPSDSLSLPSGPQLLPSEPPKSVRPCKWSPDCFYLLTADESAIQHHLIHVHNISKDSVSLCCVWDSCTKKHAEDLRTIAQHVRECHLRIEEVPCLACGYAIDKLLYWEHMQAAHPDALK
ncbi:hypothetical protein GALMADRAFT_876826 [Galerina marginata CBS 339.88]|uniref:Uncharacterized protein n=1 Tax=Galerina marginata (strain CBS 339.88) TaxID=685588 RepID=A0A067TW77_GALM3|nr:hypothetical protein GALMADRAFT_876826 [Galerina marginata CBS 339.88]